MKKIFKTSILTVLIFLFLQNLSGQVKYDMSEYIKQKFLAFTKAVPREEIYLHTDREEYIAGEYMWFSIYLADRQSSKPSLNSRIAYFELLNSENRPVVQKRILLVNGTGPGQILLPDTLSPGTYTIRAYTNWMKNFLPENCFMKDISIYNSMSNKSFRYKSYKNKLIKEEDGSEVSIPGVSLKVNYEKEESLELFINSDNSFRRANNNAIYLFIHSNGSISHISKEQLLSDSTGISVPEKGLIPGISHITVFNMKGQPVCERFIYTREKKDRILTLKTIDTCKLRSRVSLEIESPAFPPDSSEIQNLSISISPETGNDGFLSMKDYLDFGTEFGSEFLKHIYNKPLADLSDENIDQLLLNVKSNWINWTSILSGSITEFKYQMEKEYHFLSGRLIQNDPGTFDSVRYILMCTPGKEPGFQYAKTNKEGIFSFNLNIDEAVNDIIIMPDKATGASKIVMESPFSDKYPASGVLTDSIATSEPDHIQMFSANYQINKIYNVSSPVKQVNPRFHPLKPVRFYGRPDIGLVLADYIALPTMEEIFFELIPHVSLKKKKQGYELSISDRVNDSPVELTPVLLVDGVVINDPSIIADLNPEIVERIDVIKELYVVGNYVFSGLVNVLTKSGDFSNVPLSNYMIRLKYRVTDPVLQFPAPDYSLPEDAAGRIPDFRNTMYWNPSIKTDKNGSSVVSFRTSDIPYEYTISVNGFSTDGKPVSFKKHIIQVDK